MERTVSQSAAQTALHTQPKTHLLLRVAAAIALWRRNARSRRQLARLDDRQLADAGICASERDMELEKPFWRE